MELLIDSRDELGDVLRAQGPRQKFAGLTDPAPVREHYADLLGRAGERAVAGRQTARAGGPQPEAPLVSIVIPYFQMERFVEHTLASIAAQTYARVETIVVNDGSMREQDAVLTRLADRYRFSLATQINSGLGQARNLGLTLSRGEYVLPVDPDDVLMPSFVERAVAVLEQRPELAYVTAWSEYMSEDGRPLAPNGYRPLGNQVGWLERENLAGSAMAVFRRRVFERGLRYSPDLTGYEDWLLYRELTAAGELGFVIPESLLKYRLRSGSMLRSAADDRLMAELRAHVREREVAWMPSNG
jgi:glycosyltransferase involved in cell wall biosynthesis